MEQRFLIDTNVIVDVLGSLMPDKIKKTVLQMPLVVSAVTYMETLGWHRATPAQLHIIKNFMNRAIILSINNPVIERTILIRQQKKIGLGDAIIAATALVHNRTLVTRNVSDFKSIENLIVLNPWEM
ncbi:MAG: type II toxin-antitoxin system VapC family toxin [Prevotellaceae bacterium]|jgi:predicted nucleic acid-binding protein|nr:type II toxin-antitoxin system VapC family toxin [Prevotellaceae bacterium]